MIKKKRLLNTFLKLVKIDSLSLREGEVAALVKKELRKMGLRAREDDCFRMIDGEAGNIHAVVKGNVRRAPRLLLNAHLDTVSPGEGIVPVIRRGYVLSGGTTVLGADNKAGVAVILEVARSLKEELTPHGDILILFTVAEEIGLFGAKNISRKALGADYGLTLDGGDVSEIINQAPSQYNIEAQVFGKAAHAGVHPEDGINAIQVASSAIAKMRLGRIDNETTSNIGIIKGGVATNIIPDKVELKGEARSHDPKKLKAQIQHMQRALASSCRKFKARMKLRVTSSYNSFVLDQGHPLLKLVLKAASAMKIKPVIKKTGGGFDANIFNAMGVPTLIIGTGAERIHTTQERVCIDDMVLSAKFVLGIIKEVSNVKK